jgi:hypothetical protein
MRCGREMRRPTPRSVLYDWHARALRGEKVRYTHDPEAGWFVTRFVPRGAPIPASIWLEQDIDPETGELLGDEVWRAEILGESRDPEETWMRCAKRPICKLYYDQLLARLM